MAVFAAAVLLGVWLLVDPHTPDLAGQAYRVSLFRQLGFAVWDEHWYAGHNVPGYSLLFPPVAAAIGMRATACICVLASAALFQRIVHTVYGRAALWGAVAFAFAAAADVWIGRLSFALGVALGLGAVLAFVRRRPLLAAGFAALCAAASPVAGVLLALGGVSALKRRSVLALSVPAVAVAVALAALFPEGGSEPYPFTSLLATLGVLGAFVLALPPRQRPLRVGAAIYLLAVLLSLAISSPLGSNVERYGVLLCGPLLLCAALQARVRHPVRIATVAVAVAAWGVWVAWGPARETSKVSRDESTNAAYYEPVKRFFSGQPVRVEVPLLRSRWEAALLAPSVSLARGWEKQLDERYDRVLLSSGLNAASYKRWLDENAVSFVALADAPLDSSSAAEGRLIRAGLPYLRQVFSSRHWRIYAVAGATPLVTGPGGVIALGHNRVQLLAFAPGTLLVRVHYSRYLTVSRGEGCVTSAPGGWTDVVARAPGRITVRALFSLAAALGSQPACSA
ncbi:MAG TPA: hypothetical protein VGX51_04770 [Solirubrobacteraceae bacterium]|jgi:hypothetical protein|nr:hypothetical protein [Solirubrobacteraceae bacterium]